jgi:hypothetical protein
MGISNNGQPYEKRAFNAQACEQLNAWLGGFQSILNWMTPRNFNWLLHTMLSFHTMQILKKQERFEVDDSDSDSDSSDSE